MRIVQLMPNTGFDPGTMTPTAAEFKRLKTIVFAKHADIEVAASRIRDFDDQLKRSWYTAGFFFRLPAPSKKRWFSAYVDAASALLQRQGLEGISGPAFLAACHCWADVPWSAPDNAGGVLELGLDEYTGLKVSPDAWRAVLKGECQLMAPTPRQRDLRHPSEFAPRPRVYQENDAGQMVPIGDRSLWR